MTDDEIREFNGDDAAYHAWLRAEPKGFVVNTRRAKPANYRILHRASCRTIDPSRPGARRGAFTERAYIKVCGPSVDGLRRALGGLSGRCSLCNAPER